MEIGDGGHLKRTEKNIYETQNENPKRGALQKKKAASEKLNRARERNDGWKSVVA